MAILKAFKGLRPLKSKVSLIASRPSLTYLIPTKLKLKQDNTHSFLHVVKPEIDLPADLDHYSPLVYEKAKENFEKLVKDGMFFQDKTECLYIYRLTMDGRKQTGIVGAASIDDYFHDVIKKTRINSSDKEEDRKNHVRVANINAEPVFFAHPNMKALDEAVNKLRLHPLNMIFTTEDGIRHELWVVSDAAQVKNIIDLFANFLLLMLPMDITARRSCCFGWKRKKTK